MNKAFFLVVLMLPAPFVILTIEVPATSQAAPQKESTVTPSPDQIWGSLMSGNERFINGKLKTRDIVSQRRSLDKSQRPLVAVLSCADSRVPPETVFDQGLGDLFVVRAAGNSSDPIAVGSLEYAVEHLGTVMIVVLGHQSCGAVKAACSGETMPTPSLKALVQPIAKSCRVGKREQRESDDLIDFAIRDHVHETANELLTRSTVLKDAHDEGRLTIIEAYYSLDSGAVSRLR